MFDHSKPYVSKYGIGVVEHHQHGFRFDRNFEVIGRIPGYKEAKKKERRKKAKKDKLPDLYQFIGEDKSPQTRLAEKKKQVEKENARALQIERVAENEYFY